MISIAIQAGGLSKRMGTDKALIPFKGIPLVQRAVAIVGPLSEDVFITTNNTNKYPDLGVDIYRDIYPDSGALSGLITAFHYARYDMLSVVACDMPFIVPSLIEAEYKLLITTNADVVIPRTSKGLEPLLAVYKVSACQQVAFRALQKGQYRMISWFGSLKVYEMSEDEIQHYDPRMLSFININTPEDLHQAETICEE